MSMPVMTFLPSVAASSAASNWSSASVGVTLTQASALGRQGVVDSRVAGPSPREPLERARVVVQPERRPAVIQLAAAEGCSSGRPDGPSPGDVLRTEARAQGDQFG